MKLVYLLIALVLGLRGEKVHQFALVMTMTTNFRNQLNTALAAALKAQQPSTIDAVRRKSHKDEHDREFFEVVLSAAQSNGVLTGTVIATIRSSNKRLCNSLRIWLSLRGATLSVKLLDGPGLVCKWPAPLAAKYNTAFFLFY